MCGIFPVSFIDIRKKFILRFAHSQLIDIENCLLRIPGLVEFLSSNHPYMLITCICTGRKKNLGHASRLHTPVMGNSLNTAHTCRLHKTYSGQKSKVHAWVHQAYDTDQLNLFYVIIGLTHYEKQTSCT